MAEKKKGPSEDLCVVHVDDFPRKLWRRFVGQCRANDVTARKVLEFVVERWNKNPIAPPSEEERRAANQADARRGQIV
jgi:hypothetical protein